MPHFTKPSDSREFCFKSDGNTECAPSKEMKQIFNTDGFVIVRNLLSTEEVNKITTAVDSSTEFWAAASTLADNDNNRYALTQWKDPGDDIFGLCARSDKVVGICEQLLNEGELYMYSGKIIMKQEKTGGRLEWHQDYGYWYNNECLMPSLVSCFIALTKNDRENGGLQVLRGSHKCGRIKHGFIGSQQGADPDRVELLKKKLELVHCDLKTGDAIFFHCNLLHGSQQNCSDTKRWNLIFSYNAKNNSPDKVHYNAIYTEQLWRVPHDALTKLDGNQTIQHRDYFRPGTNPNLRDGQQLLNGAH